MFACAGGDNVTDDSRYSAAFTEHGVSASQMAAARLAWLERPTMHFQLALSYINNTNHSRQYCIVGDKIRTASFISGRFFLRRFCKTQNQVQAESHAFVDYERLFRSLGCARSKQASHSSAIFQHLVLPLRKILTQYLLCIAQRDFEEGFLEKRSWKIPQELKKTLLGKTQYKNLAGPQQELKIAPLGKTQCHKKVVPKLELLAKKLGGLFTDIQNLVTQLCLAPQSSSRAPSNGKVRKTASISM